MSNLLDSYQRIIELFQEDFWTDEAVFPALFEALPLLHFAKPPSDSKISRYLCSGTTARRQRQAFDRYGRVDCLLMPVYNRENYIAPLLHHAATLPSKFRVGVLYGRTVSSAALADRFPHDRFVHIDFEDFLAPTDDLSLISAATTQFQVVLERAEAFPELHNLLQANAEWFFTSLLRNNLFGRRLPDFVKATGCRQVVSSNEQVFPSSLFHWNARKAGTTSVLLFHGFPTRLYSPVKSDHARVWDEAHITTFGAWGANTKCFSVGRNEEAAAADAFASHLKAASPAHNLLRQAVPRELLFLSQLQGARIWGVNWFRECLDLLERFFKVSGTSSQIALRVRFHPHDLQEDRTEIRRRFEHLGGRYREDAYDLKVSSWFATAALTCSSTAIYTPYAMGRKVGLLWSPELESMHGPTLISGIPLIRSLRDLEQLLA